MQRVGCRPSGGQAVGRSAPCGPSDGRAVRWSQPRADRPSVPASLVPILVVAAVAIAVPAPLAAQATVERQIRENQERLQNIRQERGELERQLERLRGQMHSIQSELENLERQKSITTRLVNELDRQIGSLNAQLDSTTMDLILTEDALAEKRAVLRQRLVEIYKRGPLWTFQVLLAAESFGDLLSRYKYLYLVSRQDRTLVDEVEELRDRISDRRRQLVAIHAELGDRRSERGRELDRYVTLERGRQQALRQTRASERRTNTRLDSLARDEERLTSILAELEAARRRAVASGRAAPRAGTISVESLGTLDWPVDGDVIYRFGPGRGPDNTVIRRNGIGIRAPVGTPVRAVAGGTVEIAGLMGTYGPSILLDHGGGFYTLYLYLSRLDVQPGERVEAGQTIGRSGGAATETGPHLEFQIRGEGGIALDPLSWLKPRRE